MPFTFAHPAAVLPLRRVLWLPGLVAGALAPDVAYYLPIPGGSEITHSLGGVFWADLALGIVLLLIGWAVLAPLLALAPDGVRARVEVRSGLRVAAWRLAVSIVVGALTHVVWDAFTHVHGPAVRHWAWLRTSVVGPHRLYNVIGYVSSAGGLLVLALAAVRWYRLAPAGNPATGLPRRTRTWLGAGFGVTVVLGAAYGLADPVSRVSGYDWVRQLLVGMTQGAGVALAAYVAGWYLTRRR
ncbi:DUF4184 family protein [Amycolatopsis sp. YIM 10]|uniref:DUF4184 family protein n=1 Tax=Amycolatopsis sp. YIM 10 TaxID=2653857 RepID=UPI0012905D5C|nr:DUF4184 family protein [Amycolatopsis sp. YIM 10]QFU86956.1 hypothetical protein YIM_08730 [Amycolatopsis sp. YIM 10]